MDKSTTELAFSKDGRGSFSYWHGDTLVIERPIPLFKGWSFTHEGNRIVSVSTKLPRAERTQIVRELLQQQVPEVNVVEVVK